MIVISPKRNPLFWRNDHGLEFSLLIDIRMQPCNPAIAGRYTQTHQAPVLKVFP